jgi:hypothetical protein
MTISEQERTRIVRGWLDEGSSELSPRVHDAVLREFPRMSQDGPLSSWPMPMTAYATAAVAAAAVVVLVLAGLGLLPGTLPGGVPPPAPSATEAPTPTPEPIDRSYRTVGYVGLPPLGAVPSDPDRSDLVEISWCTVIDPCQPPYQGAVFVYADGRMIWNEYFAGRSTGWLEQRLTVEGIELVRGLAIGAPDDGGFRRAPEPEQFPDLLPASAWADDTIRPYVPSGFAACLFAGDGSGDDAAPQATLTEKLTMLPPDASALLGDRAIVPSEDAYGSDADCIGLDTEASRELDAALRRHGFEQDPSRNRYLLEYHLDVDRTGPGTMVISIGFEPILPDGTITCSGCG